MTTDKPIDPDQEHPMNSPTQRRHDEILGRLDVLIDAVQSTTARDNLHRLLAEESAAERRDEPVDVTAEPPVGSQVTDRAGDVWERRETGWAVWCLDLAAWGRRGSVWPAVRKFAPLRLTTDADRERVGLPVDTAPDVDPDEALARVACSAFWGGSVMPSQNNEAWRSVARAAREHIEVGASHTWDALTERAEKAEVAMREEVAEHDKTRAKVERLTRERDDLRARVDELIRERGQAIDRAERAEAERDEAREVAKSHVEDARDWRRRHEALRKDVLAHRWTPFGILARDDERGRDA